jgi:hypothetical protein
MTMPSRKLSKSKSRLAFVFVKAFSSLADISEDDARVESTVPFGRLTRRRESSPGVRRGELFLEGRVRNLRGGLDG